jgi:pimeloyl-ACP methyl ester carboxylesterase
VPVVFLHGIPTWSYLWRHVVAELEDDGRRVIAPDMVGYGNSEKRDGFDRSLRAQEDALFDLLGQLGIEEFDFVAHDLGGGVALRAAWHTDRVSKLVLSNAVMYDSWPVEFVTDLGLPENVGDMSVEDLTGLLDAAFRQTLVDPDEEFVEAMASRYDSEKGKISLSRNAVSTNTTHTTEIEYDAVEAETLCVWGEDDGFQPIEYAERLDDELANSAGVVGLEAQHWVPEDRPEEYPEHVVEFLGS